MSEYDIMPHGDELLVVMFDEPFYDDSVLACAWPARGRQIGNFPDTDNGWYAAEFLIRLLKAGLRVIK